MAQKPLLRALQHWGSTHTSTHSQQSLSTTTRCLWCFFFGICAGVKIFSPVKLYLSATSKFIKLLSYQSASEDGTLSPDLALPWYELLTEPCSHSTGSSSQSNLLKIQRASVADWLTRLSHISAVTNRAFSLSASELLFLSWCPFPPLCLFLHG